MENETDPSKDYEQEQRPRILIHFEGYDHSPFNLQGLGNIHRSIVDVSGRTGGKTTVFLESGSSTGTSFELFKRGIEKFGYVGRLIAELYVIERGVEPPISFVRERLEQIDQAGIDEAFVRGWLPQAHIQEYYLCSLLDDLNKTIELDVVLETHSKRVANIFREDLANYNITAAKCFDAWNRQDLVGSIEVWKEFHKTEMQAVGPREAEVVENIKLLSRKLQRTKESGAIFILMGSAHEEILPKISKKIDPQGKWVSFSSSITPAEPFSISNDKYVRRDEAIPDQDLAKLILYLMVRNEGARSAYATRQLGDLCNHYLDFSNEANGVISKLSLDQIKAICESGQSPLVVLSKM